MFRENLVPVQEFSGIDFKTPFERELVEQLKKPTRLVGYWYQELVPMAWYRRVLSSTPSGLPDWNKLRGEFNEHSNIEELESPYTVINKKWEAKSMLSIPPIRGIIHEISNNLPSIAEYIRRNCTSESYKECYLEFAKYLDNVAILLKEKKEGKFDDALILFAKLPKELKISWMGLPVEYQDDPLGFKAAPESIIAYMDRIQTIEANDQIEKYKQVAIQKYGEPPYDAKVFVANIVMRSGFLAAHDRQPSAFNIPNDPAVIEKAGNAVTYLFPNGMAEKNVTRLTPALQELWGKSCSDEAIQKFVLAHEFSHGYRPFGAAQRLGSLRSVVREGEANQKGIVLTSAISSNKSKYLMEVIEGALGFAADDLGKELRETIKEPFGRRQPTLEKILEEGPYTFDAYVLIRKSYLSKAIKYGEKITLKGMDTIVRQAEELDSIYTRMDKEGTEQSVKEELKKLLEDAKGRRSNFYLSFPNGVKKVLDKVTGNLLAATS
ncbi:MAG: hypothetical protein V1808_03755 [Candidatus Daviesbacteria bacterium]